MNKLYLILVGICAVGATIYYVASTSAEPKIDSASKNNSLESDYDINYDNEVIETVITNKHKSIIKKEGVIEQAKLRSSFLEENSDVAKAKKAKVDEEVEISELAIEMSRVNKLWINDSGETPTYSQKRQAVNNLGTNLNKKEVEFLHDYLLNGPNENVNDLHIKDEIMVKLEMQSAQNDDYVDFYIETALNTEFDGDFRGYVIQHLRTAYIDRENRRGDIRSALEKGYEHKDSDVSATSLLAAQELHKKFGGFNLKNIKEKTLELALDENSHIPSRMTAIQMIGDLKIKEGVDLLREQATEGIDTVTQIAAIYSLGEVGTESDVELLEELSKTNSYLNKSLNLSISKIKGRL